MDKDKGKGITKDLDELLDGRRTFEITFENGDVKNYFIGMPTAEDVRLADWEHAKVYNKAIRDNVFTASEMKDELIRRGILGDEYDQAGEDLRVSLAEKLIALERENEKDLRVKLAVEVANIREGIFQWNQRLTGPMASTCEQMSDDARTGYLTSAIIQYKDGKKVWETHDDFRAEPDLIVQTKARFEVMMWMQGLESDYLDKTPENQILRELLEESAKEATESVPKELTDAPGLDTDVKEEPVAVVEVEEVKSKRKRKTSRKKKVVVSKTADKA